MIGRKIILFLVSTLLLTACKNADDSALTDHDPIAKTNPQTSNSINEEEEKGELTNKWTWNDNIVNPMQSSITNAKFSKELLFKTWTRSDDNENQPALTFKKDSVDIPGEKKYIYTINHDSLRIFTSYDHSGDGFTGGIITMLTKDSLIIRWSSDDINKYIPIKNK